MRNLQREWRWAMTRTSEIDIGEVHKNGQKIERRIPCGERMISTRSKDA